MFTSVSTGTLGFPRMGPNRELKFALEKYWKAEDSQKKDAVRLLQTVTHKIEAAAWQLQLEAGLDHISVGDHYLYDGVLTWTNLLGICPRRFQSMAPGIDRMFAMARGVDGAEALGTFMSTTLPVG
jgi:5-methyltetrahydropteroyltriglutamate--homocysteine methyltransferase